MEELIINCKIILLSIVLISLLCLNSVSATDNETLSDDDFNSESSSFGSDLNDNTFENNEEDDENLNDESTQVAVFYISAQTQITGDVDNYSFESIYEPMQDSYFNDSLNYKETDDSFILSDNLSHVLDLKNCTIDVMIYGNEDVIVKNKKMNDYLLTEQEYSVNRGFINIDESIYWERKYEKLIRSAFSNVIASEGSGTIIWIGESQYNRIEKLIRKYEKSYVPGEVQSVNRNKLLKRKQRNIEKHELCDELIYECSVFFDLTPYQKKFVHYLIDRFSNFKKLHGTAKNEAIILSFIFYVRKLDFSNIRVSNYTICKKYGLMDDVFLLIVCRMCDSFVQSCPVTYQESTRYDHDILSRNGGKIS